MVSVDAKQSKSSLGHALVVDGVAEATHVLSASINACACSSACTSAILAVHAIWGMVHGRHGRGLEAMVEAAVANNNGLLQGWAGEGRHTVSEVHRPGGEECGALPGTVEPSE